MIYGIARYIIIPHGIHGNAVASFIFYLFMVCYANVRYVIEVKSHVNVCHVKIGHVKEFLVIFMGFIPMSRPVNVFYVNTKS